MAETIKKPTTQHQRSLPDDIIFNKILPRLSVKSLLHFTLVSKSWKSHIKSSTFIHAHYHHHRILDRTSPCFQLVYMADPLWKTAPEYTSMLDKPPLTEDSPRGGVWIIRSSEGLIYISKGSILYLWNPFVRTMQRIPISEDNVDLNFDFDFDFAPPRGKTTLGFGYSGGNHRVMKMWWEEEEEEVDAEVHSLSTDLWRTIVPPSVLEVFLEKKDLHDKSYWSYQFQLPMVKFKGSIYWLARWDDEHEHNPVYKIVRFDLNKRLYHQVRYGLYHKELDKELFEVTEAPRSGKLAVVDGCLVLLSLVSEWNEGFHVLAYVKKELVWRSSFWVSKDFYFRKDATDRVYFEKTTTGGHIVLAKRDGRLFSYDCYVDGNRLGFKFRDTGVKFESRNIDLTSLQEILCELEYFCEIDEVKVSL